MPGTGCRAFLRLPDALLSTLISPGPKYVGNYAKTRRICYSTPRLLECCINLAATGIDFAGGCEPKLPILRPNYHENALDNDARPDPLSDAAEPGHGLAGRCG